MSCLSFAELKEVSDLVDFERGPGYVLEFSDRDFARFFASELSVNIGDARYADTGSSKGKRLRRFLELTDNRTALRALRALWTYRCSMIGQAADPVADAKARFDALVERLGGEVQPKPQAPPAKRDDALLDDLKGSVLELAKLDAHPRGYAFERFLGRLFEVNGLRPREPFRNRGEQIDGSFVVGSHAYLLEAKWQAAQIGAADLHAFEGKLRNKAAWARGLFVSYSGFTQDGLHAFGSGKQTLCADGLDLFEMLDRKLTFETAIEAKARRAAETGSPFIRLRDLRL